VGDACWRRRGWIHGRCSSARSARRWFSRAHAGGVRGHGPLHALSKSSTTSRSCPVRRVVCSDVR
jgi:hypothetical protein